MWPWWQASWSLMESVASACWTFEVSVPCAEMKLWFSSIKSKWISDSAAGHPSLWRRFICKAQTTNKRLQLLHDSGYYALKHSSSQRIPKHYNRRISTRSSTKTSGLDHSLLKSQTRIRHSVYCARSWARPTTFSNNGLLDVDAQLCSVYIHPQIVRKDDHRVAEHFKDAIGMIQWILFIFMIAHANMSYCNIQYGMR